ncbi:MAG: hypothetical protein ACO1OB_00585 [Archangium sp.]
MKSVQFDEVKVFSATLARERDALGETITRWLEEHPSVVAVDRDVTQSSDREFHCLVITLYLQRTGQTDPVVPPPRIYTFTPEKRHRR